MADNNIFNWIPAVAQLAQLNMQIGQNMERIKKERDEELKRTEGFNMVSQFAKQFQEANYGSETEIAKGYGDMLTQVFASKNPYAIQSSLQVLPTIFEQKRGMLKDAQLKEGVKAYGDFIGSQVQTADLDLGRAGLQAGTGTQLVQQIYSDPRYTKMLEFNPELAIKFVQDSLNRAMYQEKGLFTFDQQGNINYNKIGKVAGDPSVSNVRSKQYQFRGNRLYDGQRAITDYVQEFGEDAVQINETLSQYQQMKAQGINISNASMQGEILKASLENKNLQNAKLRAVVESGRMPVTASMAKANNQKFEVNALTSLTTLAGVDSEGVTEDYKNKNPKLVREFNLLKESGVLSDKDIGDLKKDITFGIYGVNVPNHVINRAIDQFERLVVNPQFGGMAKDPRAMLEVLSVEYPLMTKLYFDKKQLEKMYIFDDSIDNITGMNQDGYAVGGPNQ